MAQAQNQILEYVKDALVEIKTNLKDLSSKVDGRIQDLTDKVDNKLGERLRIAENDLGKLQTRVVIVFTILGAIGLGLLGIALKVLFPGK